MLKNVFLIMSLFSVFACSAKKKSEKIVAIQNNDSSGCEKRLLFLEEENSRLKFLIENLKYSAEKLEKRRVNSASSVSDLSKDSSFLPPSTETVFKKFKAEPSEIIDPSKTIKITGFKPYKNEIRKPEGTTLKKSRKERAKDKLPQDYSYALDAFFSGDYKKSSKLFNDMIVSGKLKGRYLRDNLYYWRGESMFQLGDIKDAREMFEEVLNNREKGYKNADALLKIALCDLKLNDKSQAKAKIDKLLKEFPESEAARKAKNLFSN